MSDPGSKVPTPSNRVLRRHLFSRHAGARVAPDGAMPMIPTVHMNGSSGEVLRDQWTAAWRALDGAISALCDAGPNARDYYVQGTDAPIAAQREHEARVKMLRQMRDDVGAVVDGIEQQIFERELARVSR